MTNAPEGAFKIPNFIDQLELAKFGKKTGSKPIRPRTFFTFFIKAA